MRGPACNPGQHHTSPLFIKMSFDMYLKIHTYIYIFVVVTHPTQKKTFWIAGLPSPYCPCQLLQSNGCKVSSSEPHIKMHFEVRKSGTHLLWAEEAPRLFGFEDLDSKWFSWLHSKQSPIPRNENITVWHLSSCSKRRSRLEAQFQSPSKVVGCGILCGAGFTSQRSSWKKPLPQQKTCHRTNTR